MKTIVYNQQPRAVAGVSGLDSMIGISSRERKKKQALKKRESDPFDRASVTDGNHPEDVPTSHRFAISYRLEKKKKVNSSPQE